MASKLPLGRANEIALALSGARAIGREGSAVRFGFTGVGWTVEFLVKADSRLDVRSGSPRRIRSFSV